MPDKTTLRRLLLDARNATPPDVRMQRDTAIGKQVAAWWNRHRVKTLGIYWPLSGEPDLRPIYDFLAMQGVGLSLPIVTGKDAPLSFVDWKPGDKLVKDGMGVKVPVARSPLVHPDALLIPCLGFNAAQIRLGYGGGFYDRTLAAAPRPFAVGVAYASALSDFEGEPHDIAMDLVITDHPGTTIDPGLER